MTWLSWELGAGQARSKSLDYAPLPDDLVAKAKALVGTITT